MNVFIPRPAFASARVLPRTSVWSPAARKHAHRRGLHASRPALVLKPYLLADIGEGIREVQIIQWFVKPGARVEQFQALCEVQSDKATVEITSRFDGIIKKLHYDADDMAQVGKALCDIDIQSEISEDDAALTETEPESSSSTDQPTEPQRDPEPASSSAAAPTTQPATQRRSTDPNAEAKRERHRTLSTPAVRHLCKDLDVDIADVPGTGKDGRVLKEDVQRFASGQAPSQAAQPPTQDEQPVALTPVQSGMFKAMTRSLSIPHFLYSDAVDLTALTALRAQLNARADADATPRLSALAFIVKAVSLALAAHPVLNARVDAADPARPALVLRRRHHIGFACDTPAGLLVPVIRDAQDRSVAEIGSEISRLGALGRAGRLGAADLAGGTFTVSNVGSIGGGAVAPVLVEGQTGIVAVGRARSVPAFDEAGAVVRREEAVVSWSADHRVVDGATAARCAEMVRRLIETPGLMTVQLR